jgi:hypothetical protein
MRRPVRAGSQAAVAATAHAAERVTVSPVSMFKRRRDSG